MGILFVLMELVMAWTGFYWLGVIWLINTLEIPPKYY